MRALILFVGLFLTLMTVGETASAQRVVGEVLRVQGEASASLNGTNAALTVGSPIQENAVVATGRQARLVVAFLDRSELTMGENGRIVIDSLVFSPDASTNQRYAQSLRVIDGTFRLLTGAIAKADRAAIVVRTPVATIGIRGTDFFGGPMEVGMPPGQLHYGFLRIDGAIDVQTAQGSVTLDDVNEGTFLPMAGGVAPTPPAIWSQRALDEAFASVAFR